jgi:hypothetical protein
MSADPGLDLAGRDEESGGRRSTGRPGRRQIGLDGWLRCRRSVTCASRQISAYSRTVVVRWGDVVAAQDVRRDRVRSARRRCAGRRPCFRWRPSGSRQRASQTKPGALAAPRCCHECAASEWPHATRRRRSAREPVADVARVIVAEVAAHARPRASVAAVAPLVQRGRWSARTVRHFGDCTGRAVRPAIWPRRSCAPSRRLTSCWIELWLRRGHARDGACRLVGAGAVVRSTMRVGRHGWLCRTSRPPLTAVCAHGRMRTGRRGCARSVARVGGRSAHRGRATVDGTTRCSASHDRVLR